MLFGWAVEKGMILDDSTRPGSGAEEADCSAREIGGPQKERQAEGMAGSGVSRPILKFYDTNP